MIFLLVLGEWSIRMGCCLRIKFGIKDLLYNILLTVVFYCSFCCAIHVNHYDLIHLHLEAFTVLWLSSNYGWVRNFSIYFRKIWLIGFCSLKVFQVQCMSCRAGSFAMMLMHSRIVWKYCSSVVLHFCTYFSMFIFLKVNYID